MPSPATAHQASTLSEHRFKSHLRCFASGSLLNALGGTEGAQGKNVPYQKMMQDLNIFCIKTNLPFHWVSRLASQVLRPHSHLLECGAGTAHCATSHVHRPLAPREWAQTLTPLSTPAFSCRACWDAALPVLGPLPFTWETQAEF